MRSCWASIWFLSMSILTSFTAPLASFTTFSIMGCKVLHGPHHGAQKSTITGTVREVSSTSLANFVWSLSLIRSAGTACGAAPCSNVSIGPREGNFGSPAMWPPPPGDARGGRPPDFLAIIDLGDDAGDLGGGKNRYGAGAVGAGESRGLRHFRIVDVGRRQGALAAVEPFDAQVAAGILLGLGVECLGSWIVLGADDGDVSGLAAELAVGQQRTRHHEIVLGQRNQVTHAVLGIGTEGGAAGVAGEQVEEPRRRHVLVDLLDRLGEHALRPRFGRADHVAAGGIAMIAANDLGELDSHTEIAALGGAAIELYRRFRHAERVAEMRVVIGGAGMPEATVR